MNFDSSERSPGLGFWGGETTDSYHLLFAIHILAIITAFGPLFLTAAINRLATKRSGEVAQAIATIPLNAARAISIPSIVVAVVAGILLVLDSGKNFKFDQTWISIAFSLVLVLAVVYWFLLIPAQKRLIEAVQADKTDDHATAVKVRSAKVSTAMATGLIHLGMVALVLIMIWKPGY